MPLAGVALAKNASLTTQSQAEVESGSKASLVIDQHQDGAPTRTAQTALGCRANLVGVARKRELASNRLAGRAKAVTRHNTRTRPVRVGEHHLKDWLSPAESRARRRRRDRRGTTSDPAVGYDACSTSARRSASASSPRRRRRRCRRRQSHGHEQASGRRRRRCLPHAAPRQRVTLEFESALRQNVSNSSPDARG